MTVRDLIKYLEKLDTNMEVTLADYVLPTEPLEEKNLTVTQEGKLEIY